MDFSLWNSDHSIDLPTLASFEKQWMTIAWSLQQWEESLGPAKGYCLGLLGTESYLQGICLLHQLGAEDSVHLVKIALDQASRGKGLAVKLLDFTLSNVKDPMQEVFLEVDSLNLRAIKFYERIGFQQVGRRGRKLKSGGYELKFLKRI